MQAAHLYKLPSQALSPGWSLGAARSDREVSPAAVVSAAVSAVPVWLGGRAAASREQDRSAGVSEDRSAGDGLADACAHRSRSVRIQDFGTEGLRSQDMGGLRPPCWAPCWSLRPSLDSLLNCCARRWGEERVQGRAACCPCGVTSGRTA